VATQSTARGDTGVAAIERGAIDVSGVSVVTDDVDSIAGGAKEGRERRRKGLLTCREGEACPWAHGYCMRERGLRVPSRRMKRRNFH
jgi:hypothetical protein